MYSLFKTSRKKGEKCDRVKIIELKQAAPAQGGVRVLQACLKSWCFLHQETFPAYKFSLWGSQVRSN